MTKLGLGLAAVVSWGRLLTSRPSPASRWASVFPHMAVLAPGVGNACEPGIGALVAWADRLWAIGYVAHVKGEGIGLARGRHVLPPEPGVVPGTFANRLVPWELAAALVGPHAIAPKGACGRSRPSRPTG